MRIEEDIKLDFCDVLIRPKRSETASRSEIDLLRKYCFKNTQFNWEGIPIFASNMDTVGTFSMAKALNEYNVQTCLHKHYSISDLIEFFLEEEANKNTWYSLGITEKDFDKFEAVYHGCASKVLNVCIDVANGYSSFFVDRIKTFKDKFPSVNIMAGNVCTPEMVWELLFNGVDIVKVGIGPGSVCTTRKVAGVGYPQLSAIIECADAAHGLGGHICADGGCQMPGDVAKAFGGGSDFVMLGGMFAGCEECEGYRNKNLITGVTTFSFYGMSSSDAMNKHNGGVADYRSPEGKSVEIPLKGSASSVVKEVLGGLRSACSYVGAKTLKDLSKCTTFVRVNQTHNRIFGE